MSTEENKHLMRHFFEVFAPDALHHKPFSGATRGREGNKQGRLLLFAASPDWHITIEDLIAEGDNVWVRMMQ